MSKEIVLTTNQMAFFIYNLFGHDITHDGHPSTLGTPRFASAILKVGDEGKEIMNRKGGKNNQSGGSKEYEDQYFKDIGQMMSRDVLLYSVGTDLIKTGKLYAISIKRDPNMNNEQQWQNMTFIIIDVKRIIDNYNKGQYYIVDPIYPGFVFYDDEIIHPYDIVVSYKSSRIGGSSYTLSFPGKNFDIIVPVDDTNTILINTIFINYENQTGSYDKVSLDLFKKIVPILGDEFLYNIFGDYIEQSTFDKLQDYSALFSSYILKKYSPEENSRLFFSTMVSFFEKKDATLFIELFHSLQSYRNYYQNIYTSYVSTILKTPMTPKLSVYGLSEIFIGQISQITSIPQFENYQNHFLGVITFFSSDESNAFLQDFYEFFKTQANFDQSQFTFFVDFFIVSKQISGIGIDDFTENYDDSSYSGGAPNIPYESFVLDNDFIDTLNNISQLSDSELSRVVQTILPRENLPPDFGQRLYGALSARQISVNFQNMSTFFIKDIPNDSLFDCLRNLSRYKNVLINDPNTVTNIKQFIEDFLNILTNDDKQKMNEDILSLLNSPENRDKLMCIFVYNVSGKSQISGEKPDKKKIGILSNFEQYVLRQIRIFIFLLYTKPAMIDNKFFENLLASLKVYFTMLKIITEMFDSAPGLTTLQKINSAYMIASSVLSISRCMNSIRANNDLLLKSQIDILSSIYLKKNVSLGKTGKGDIDEKLMKAFQSWISTGSKGAGNFAGNAGYSIGNAGNNLWSSLNVTPPTLTDYYYINNAVTATNIGIPPFFCPLSSIMDGQSTCNNLNSALKMNGVEYGTMDVVVRDGVIGSRVGTGETMRFHIRLEQSGTIASISAFLKIGDEVLINVGKLSSTPTNISVDPVIKVDLNSRITPLEASECLKEIINVNVNSISNSDGTFKSWDDYLNLINSPNNVTFSSKLGNNTTSGLRRQIISASFRKCLGDYLQELNMVVDNGGYVSNYATAPVKGTRILPPNTFRLGLSNDRPSGVRILLLLLFGQGDINNNSMGGYINNDRKYMIGLRNKKKRGGVERKIKSQKVYPNKMKRTYKNKGKRKSRKSSTQDIDA
jgi:hypothetical protein